MICRTLNAKYMLERPSFSWWMNISICKKELKDIPCQQHLNYCPN